MPVIKEIKALNVAILERYRCGVTIHEIANGYHVHFIAHDIAEPLSYIIELVGTTQVKKYQKDDCREPFSTNEDDYGTTNLNYDCVDEVEDVEVDRRSFSERLKFSKIMMK
jgi:hypothetical protein